MIALPRVIGHRGAAAVAPENTLVGLRRAAALGASWVEFDVMLTGDGVPVLFHDDSLKRTTGRDAPMAETALSDLGSLEAGAWFAPEFAGEPVPTLEKALALLLTLGVQPNIEIKPSRGRDRETALATIEVLARCWPGERPPPLISSFSRECLRIARRNAPGLPRGLNLWRLPWDWVRALRALECSTLHLAAKRFSKKTARRAKEAGYGLVTFTVNEPGEARRLLDLGVDTIITDTPGEIAAALG